MVLTARLMVALVMVCACVCARAASGDPASPLAAQSGAQQLDAAAETTIQRLPTCESAIRARVSDWRARAAIACRATAGGDVPSCVDAQLKARAEQLKRLRSCRFL